MKLLIAEDNENLQKSVGLLMNLWGFDFDMASNGLEALEKAKFNNGEYDLCLMDLEMPVMGGCEAALMIRRQVGYFPILALSGNLHVSEKYAQAGMDDYLEKPYEPETLLYKIHELTTGCRKNKRVNALKESPVARSPSEEVERSQKK